MTETVDASVVRSPPRKQQEASFKAGALTLIPATNLLPGPLAAGGGHALRGKGGGGGDYGGMASIAADVSFKHTTPSFSRELIGGRHSTSHGVGLSASVGSRSVYSGGVSTSTRAGNAVCAISADLVDLQDTQKDGGVEAGNGAIRGAECGALGSVKWPLGKRVQNSLDMSLEMPAVGKRAQTESYVSRFSLAGAASVCRRQAHAGSRLARAEGKDVVVYDAVSGFEVHRLTACRTFTKLNKGTDQRTGKASDTSIHAHLSVSSSPAYRSSSPAYRTFLSESESSKQDLLVTSSDQFAKLRETELARGSRDRGTLAGGGGHATGQERERERERESESLRHSISRCTGHSDTTWITADETVLPHYWAAGLELKMPPQSIPAHITNLASICTEGSTSCGPQAALPASPVANIDADLSDLSALIFATGIEVMHKRERAAGEVVQKRLPATLLSPGPHSSSPPAFLGQTSTAGGLQVGVGIVLAGTPMGLVVTRILPDGAVDRDQRIRVGDVLLLVGGQTTRLLYAKQRCVCVYVCVCVFVSLN